MTMLTRTTTTMIQVMCDHGIFMVHDLASFPVHTYQLSSSFTMLGNGLVVSTPTVVAGSIPAFSTCLFHVVPRVLGGAAEEKTGPVILYRQIKRILIVSIYLVGPSAIIG